MKREEMLLWKVEVAERVDGNVFDTITVAADHVFEACTVAEKELGRRKLANLVVVSAKYVGEAISWGGGS